MIITSRGNPTVKAIRSLRDRKHREHGGRFYVEGIHIVAEALQVGAPVEQLVVAPELLASRFAQDVVAAWQQTGGRRCEVSADVFRSISIKDRPQGLAAVVAQRWITLSDILPDDEPLWIALSNVQDPGNLGAVLRSADATGCSGLMLIGATADPFDPESIRASMGAVFSQRILRTTASELASWKARQRYELVGASGSAAVDYQSVVYPAKLVVLMGSEQQGLSPEEQAMCDRMVRIPMVGRSDSLNLAVAAGVILYEVFNQRRRSEAA